MSGTHAIKRVCALFLCAILFLTLLPIPSVFADSFKYATPTLLGLESKNGGLNLTWSAVSGAPGYSVHRRDNDGPWKTIAKGVAGTSYLDTSISGNTKYTYTVRVCENGALVSWYDTVGLSYTSSWAYGTPVLKGITSTASSITVSWNAVGGASRYSVHRRDNSGPWKTLTKNATGTSYTDTNVSAGVNYTYTVRVVNGANAFASDFDPAGLTASIGGGGTWQYATPVLGSIKYDGKSVIITWGTVANAPGYSVHRRVNGGAWTTLAKNVKATSYTDSAVYSGNSYIYTVRVNDNSGRFASDFDPVGLSISVPSSIAYSYPAPVMKTPVRQDNGVKVMWEPVPGAQYYSVHRRDNGGSWTTLAKNVKGTSYVDQTAQSGHTYEYTARVNLNGKFASDFQNPGTKITYYPCANPNFTLKSTAKGVEISWGAINGAEKYRVFRISGGKWVVVGDTTATTYLDKNVVSGTTYTYTVRCMRGKAYASWFLESGKSITFYGNGIVTKLVNGDKMVTVNWRNVSGAASYEVLRRVNGTSEWKTMTKSATGTSWADTQVVHGTTYDYIVRALDSAGKVVGEYDSTGMSIRYIDPPDMIEATIDSDGITVSWNPIVGVDKFQVYRRRAGSSDKWDIIGSTGDLYFVDKNVERGVAYEYAAACLNSAGTDLISAMSAKVVKSASWVNTPVLDSIELVENTVTLKWKAVENFGGATITNYQILRKTDNTGWQKLATVAYGTNTYADALGSAVSGTKYTYTVYCLNGTTQISDYDSNGLTITFYEVPPITEIKNETNGVYMTWNIVDSTGQYFIYRKVADNNWIRIASTTDRHFLDTSAANAVTYNYAICSADLGENLLSDHFKTPGSYSTITYYVPPEVVSVENAVGGVRVKWNMVEGVTNYRVLHKTANTDWETLADVTTLDYLDTAVSSGTTYTYAVFCSNGTDVISTYDHAVKSVHYLAAPNMESATAIDKGISVIWSDVPGAAQYAVYRRLQGQDDYSWQRIVTVTSDVRNYTDLNESIQTGQAYEYTVRAINGDAMSMWDNIVTATAP